MNSFLRFTFLGATASAMILLSAALANAQGTVIAFDDFNRPDETPFAVGGNWGRTIAGNYDGNSSLTSNQVTSVSNEGIYYWQGTGTFSSTRQFARQRVVQKDGELGLVLLGGPDQAIMVGWGPPGVGSTVYIYWYSNGQDRGQLTTGPSTLNNGDIIEAVLDNGIIYAKVNGVTVKSVANATTLTSGTPGFITYLNPGLPGQVAILDDWEAGTPDSYTIGGTITEEAAGLSGVLVTASGGFSGSATTAGDGTYTISGVPSGATSILLTPTLSGHTMSPTSRTVAGPVTANVTGQDFTSTPGAEPPPGVVAFDDFNRADETPLVTGGNWQQALGSGTVNLIGNQVTGANADGVYYWQGSGTFDNARQFARARVTQAGGQVGIVLLGASSQGLVVAWNGGTLYIYWYTGGSNQGNLTTVSSTLQNGDVIEALLDGGTVYAKINGATVASVANTTTLSSGRPGFETYLTGASLDDWEAGTPSSATYTISGTITENAAGLGGVLVAASGGFSGSATTAGNGAYTITGVPSGATSILLTPTLSGHTMSPPSRTVAGPVTANVSGEDFTSTPSAGPPPGVIAYDDFNRANETPFAVGGNWQHPFGAGFVNLTGNHIASASGEAIYCWQGSGTFDNARQFARLKVLQAGGQVGVVLLGATNQALVVSWGGGRLFIYWYLNGTHQGELANIVSVVNDGDVIEGVLDNGTIYAKINGAVVHSVANTTSLTSGKPGFETYLTGAIFDDWEAGTPPSYSISGTITSNTVGLSGVLVTASGGFNGSTTTVGGGAYTITGVPPGATSIVLTPTLSGHTMSPFTRTVAGPMTADVSGQDFTSTLNLGPTPGVVASDNFNRADETPFAVGGNWQHPFAGGTANLTGNGVAGASAEALYYWQGSGTFDNARQYARARVTQAGGQVGLVLLGASGQALVVAWNAGTLYIYWYSAGSYRGNVTTTSSTLQNGDQIEAVLDGGVVRAKINGSVVLSTANTTTLSSGRPGFETYQAGAGLDDWEAGSPQSTVAASVPPAACISNATPCVTVPVLFTRIEAAPARAIGVQIQLSPELQLCDPAHPENSIQRGSWLGAYEGAFQVVDLGGGAYRVDQTILGTPCGITTGGQLFTLAVTNAGSDGTGTITVTSVLARDCDNHPIGSGPGTAAAIPVDRTAPAAVADLVTSPLAVAGTNAGTRKIQLTFTVPGDAATVEVYRAPFGGYPLYDRAPGGGQEPAAPIGYPPGAPWTLSALAGPGSDDPGTRDFWYYVVATKDACGNVAYSTRSGGALDYVLGDVHDGLADCAGNNQVNGADIAFLGAHYGESVPTDATFRCLDFGPTTDYYVTSRPQPDGALNFEDLAVLALNFGTTTPAPLARSRPTPAEGTARGVDALALVVPTLPGVGETFEVALRFEGSGAVRALSAELGYDRAMVEALGAKDGELLAAQPAPHMMLSAHPGNVDVALLGGDAGITGRGTLATVRFRVLANGAANIALVASKARDAANREVALGATATAPGVPAPAAVSLSPAMPSPFRDATTFEYGLARPASVTLAIYGVDGRRIRTLATGDRAAGIYRVSWDGRDDGGRTVVAGLFFARLTTPDAGVTRTVMRVQ